MCAGSGCLCCSKRVSCGELDDDVRSRLPHLHMQEQVVSSRCQLDYSRNVYTCSSSSTSCDVITAMRYHTILASDRQMMQVGTAH